MILVIGAAASGKTAFVESLGYTEADMAVGVLDDKPVLTNLQALVWQDPEHALEMFDALCAKDVVICDEVGSGVIPVDPQETATDSGFVHISRTENFCWALYEIYPEEFYCLNGERRPQIPGRTCVSAPDS